MWLDKISIPRKLTLAFAITLASFAVSGFVVFNTMQERTRSSRLATLSHAQELESLNAVAAHLDMAQTVRGYLLTGVERHKKLYEAAAVDGQIHSDHRERLAEQNVVGEGDDIAAGRRKQRRA